MRVLVNAPGRLLALPIGQARHGMSLYRIRRYVTVRLVPCQTCDAGS